MNMIKVDSKWVAIEEVLNREILDYQNSYEEYGDMDDFWPFDD